MSLYYSILDPASICQCKVDIFRTECGRCRCSEDFSHRTYRHRVRTSNPDSPKTALTNGPSPPTTSELAAIALSALLILTGLVGLIVHALHLRIRRLNQLHLTAEPGSIASSLALSSHSGFGDLLVPYDDRQSMRRKLGALRFSLDRRTGAIVAEEYDYVLSGRERGYVLGEYEPPESQFGSTATVTMGGAQGGRGKGSSLGGGMSEVLLSPPTTATFDTHPLVSQPM